MSSVKLDISTMPPPWDKVFDIAGVLSNDSWLLIGGLMVQAHARLASLEFRATTDIDMLINVMASNSNISKVVKGLESTDLVHRKSRILDKCYDMLNYAADQRRCQFVKPQVGSFTHKWV